MGHHHQLLEVVESDDVRRVLRPAIEGVLFPLGFARTGKTPAGLRPPRPTGWWLPVGGEFAVLWLQLDRKYGFSKLSGSKFTLNFELSSRPTALTSDKPATRFWQLLNGSQKRAALAVERQVVADIPPPPDRIAHVLGGRLRSFHLPWEDVWLRYGTRVHVEMWADFLYQNLGSAVNRFLARAGVAKPIDK